jgi:ribonuclease HI
VFKAGYYPNSSFFASSLGNNPSFAWRSIWKSCHVLLHGCRWKIGDGTKVDVMNDPWLKKEDGKWVQSPQEQGVSHLSVNQRMLHNSKEWDSNKIQSLFPPHVANSILGVPLFDDNDGDQLVWDDDMYGNYSVKSGYNLQLQAKIQDMATHENDYWKCLWKIQSPPKTKHLLWRICKGCLPTRSRLKEKQVQCPLICPMCELEEENEWHFVYACENSKRAWQGAGIDHIISPYAQQGISAKDCILHICHDKERKDAGKVAMLLWLLWQNRNNWVWNNEKEQGQQLGVKAMRMWFEWEAVQQAYNNNNSSDQQQRQQQMMWQPPMQGKFKCNVDAGIHVDARKTTAGWCVRDYRGHLILGGSSWIHGKCSPNEGEALALFEAMKELQHRGFHDVIFETDAHNIVHALRRRNTGVSEFSSIIYKIKCMLSLNVGFEVKPIRRQANMIAHTIARAAISWSRRRIFDSILPCINNLLHNEMI